jgi:regulator of nucleoside diphosphate kinase
MTIEKTAAAASRVKPRITLSADDYLRLSELAHAARNQMPDLAAELAEEIE